MSRMQVINIKQLIDDYQENNSTAKQYKDKAEELGGQIKTYFANNNTNTESSDNWVAKVTITQKETLDEVRAIEVLKESLTDDKFNEVVKTKFYIDEDALEKLVYNGEFDISLLEPCKVLGKKVETLRITKKK